MKGKTKMNPVTKIEVHNLACFGGLELTLGPENLLLGRNGTGKSTFLDILFQLRGLVNAGCTAGSSFPKFQCRDEAPTVVLEGQRGKYRFRYSIHLKRGSRHSEALSSGLLGFDWSIQTETLELLSGQSGVLTQFKEGRFTSQEGMSPVELVADRSPMAMIRFSKDSAVTAFKQWLDGIWLLRLEPGRMRLEPPAEASEEELHVSGKNFVAWLLNFRRRKSELERLARELKPVIEGLEQLEFVKKGTAWVLLVRFKHGTKHGTAVDFNYLSDGQRCLIVLYSVVILRRNDIHLLLLDEPDAHITPTEIEPLLDLLRGSAGTPPWQLIIASHHPSIIDLMAPGKILEFMQEGGVVQAMPFDLDRADGITASRHLVLRGRK